MFKIKRGLHFNQSGFTSVYISLTVMFILSLIVFSFASISYVSYADTYENSLNLQAVYAAETALNDVRRELMEEYLVHTTRINSIPIDLGSPTLTRIPNMAADNLVFDTSLSRSNIDSNASGNFAYSTTGLDILDNRLAIGLSDQKKVYVYEKGTSGWSRKQTISNSANGFGYMVSLHGNYIAIAAKNNQVYIYEKGSTSWSQKTSISIMNSSFTGNWSSKALTSMVLHTKAGTTDKLGLALGIAIEDGAYTGNWRIGFVYLLEQQSSITSWAQRSNGPISCLLNGYGTGYGCQGNYGFMVDYGGSNQHSFEIDIIDDLLVVAYTDWGSSSQQRLAFFEWQNNRNYGLNGRKVTVAGNSGVLGAIPPVAFGHSIKGSQKTDFYAVYGDYEYNGKNSSNTNLRNRGNVYIDKIQYNNSNKNLVSTPSFSTATNWLLAEKDTTLGSNLKTNSNFGFKVAISSKAVVVASKERIYIFKEYTPPPVTFGPRFSAQLINVTTDCHNSGIPELDFDIGDDVSSGNSQLVGYACLEMNVTPDLLFYDKVINNQPLQTLLDTLRASGSGAGLQENMDDLRIFWSNPNKTLSAPFKFKSSSFSYPELPTYANWDIHTPILRVQLLPFDAEAFHRLALLQEFKTFYLYPTEAASSSRTSNHHRAESVLDYRAIKDGGIYPVKCYKNEGVCDVSLVNLPATVNYTRDDPDTAASEAIPDTSPNTDHVKILIQVATMYQDASVGLKAYYGDDTDVTFADKDLNVSATQAQSDIFLSPLHFKDVQAVIRATGYASGGKAQVRLEERMPLRPRFEIADRGIKSSQTLCKVLVTDQDKGTSTTNDYSVFFLQPNALQRILSSNAIDNCEVI